METNRSLTGAAEERQVSIPLGPVRLKGSLVLPKDARDVVPFAHGSGSSRYSPRNRYVARVLNDGNLATLLIDLLTLEEEAIDVQTAQLRFNTTLLAERVVVRMDPILVFGIIRSGRAGSPLIIINAAADF